MNMLLMNGYPFPYPQDLDEDQQYVLSNAAPSVQLVLEGVVHFEMKHTITVEFDSLATAYAAMLKTGWKQWNYGVILEAEHSVADGYDFPALVANGVAYCGVILKESAP